jgi:pseudouridylate synthase
MNDATLLVMNLVNRAGPDSVALESTLLVHGLPPGAGTSLAHQLIELVKARGARAALVGVVGGCAIVGMNSGELHQLLEALPGTIPKANTANLGALLFRGSHAATTVSTTMELAAAAGVRIFATGGLGGVHPGYGSRLDISADLLALARFPVAVIASGVKSILDVASTREALETLGIPVIGFGTNTLPAFYLRLTDLPVDARFDDAGELARYIDAELKRTGRGILIASPIPVADAIAEDELDPWLRAAEARAHESDIRGRDLTPAILRHLHEVSGGRTLRANLALVRNNADLAAQLCRAMLEL